MMRSVLAKTATACFHALVLVGFLLNIVRPPGAIAGEALSPPDQRYYLHTQQRADFGTGPPLWFSRHEVAWAEGPGNLIVQNQFTVELWVKWEGSDLEEVQAATGVDLDQMTLFCGQQAYGIGYRLGAATAWTAFLQTDFFTWTAILDFTIPENDWTHLALTYDTSDLRVYVNGVLASESPVAGDIPVVGGFEQVCKLNDFDPRTEVFAIGSGKGFTGGVRELRIWDHARTGISIQADAGTPLNGDEAGLLGYWPMDDASDPLRAKNKVAGGPDLALGSNPLSTLGPERPTWRLTAPVFDVREDLVEDVFSLGCQQLRESGSPASWWVDIHDDGDLDLIFAGADFEPFGALIRTDDGHFVYDSNAAFFGPHPTAYTSFVPEAADFNGDELPDVFSGNTGPDFTGDAGAINVLLLSRPDGLLEDASDHLVGPPCTLDEPLFEGQHFCFGGSDYGGRKPGIRYPDTTLIPVPLTKDYTHGGAVGDVDHDGDVDIVVGNTGAGLEAQYILVNDGTGNFVANYQWLPSHGSNGLGWRPRSYLVDDLDEDGHVDLISAPAGSDEQWTGGIFWGDGSGDYSDVNPTIIRPTGSIPQSYHELLYPESEGGIAIADLDGDGDKDLLVTWDPEFLFVPVEDISPSSLQVLLNLGDRTFGDYTLKLAGLPPQETMIRDLVYKQRMVIMDFNNDGCSDLLFNDNTSYRDQRSMWVNNCNGYLHPVQEPLLPKRGGAAIPFDYEGDGDIDLLYFRALATRYDENQPGCESQPFRGDHYDLAVLLKVGGSDIQHPLIAGDGFESTYHRVFKPYSPPPVSILRSEPFSPANETNPMIIGTAEANSTVKLYSDKHCTTFLASGPAASFAAAGIGIQVPNHSATQIYATVIPEGGGEESACSELPFLYVAGDCADMPGLWASEARDCTAEDCSGDGGLWKSWDGKIWCSALQVHEGTRWLVDVPPGVSNMDFWLDWGAWDLNPCGEGMVEISVADCDIQTTVVRGAEEQNFQCNVTGESSLVIFHPGGDCNYVIVGNPTFY